MYEFHCWPTMAAADWYMLIGEPRAHSANARAVTMALHALESGQSSLALALLEAAVRVGEDVLAEYKDRRHLEREWEKGTPLFEALATMPSRRP